MGVAYRPILAFVVGTILVIYLSSASYRFEIAKTMPVVSGIFSDVSGEETLIEAGTGSVRNLGTGSVVIKGLPDDLEGKKLKELGVSDLARTLPGKRYRYDGTDGITRLIDWKD